MNKKDLRRIKKLAKGKSLTFAQRLKIVDRISSALWRQSPPEERIAVAQNIVEHGTAMYATAIGSDGKYVTFFESHPVMRLIEKIDAIAQASAGDVSDVVAGIMAKLEAPAN